MSRQLRQEEWSISDWSSIRQGQVSLIHGRNGDELQVYVLSTKAPAPAPAHVRRETPQFTGNCYLVSTFDSGNTNGLGGYFNAFQSQPSSARALIQRWPGGDRALTLQYVKAGSGYCGLWIHLFDFKQAIEHRRYFNASPFSTLTFWIRGKQGGERIRLKVADARWERQEDALAAGEVGDFVESGTLATSWQRAVVSLDHLPARVNRQELAGLVFEAAAPGSGQAGIRDLAFCTDSKALPELSQASGPPPSRPAQTALWLWNTTEVLAAARKQQDLLDFLLEEQINRVFMQLPNENESLGQAGEIKLDSRKLGPLLALLNQHGIKVHALDGFKNYALPEWHARVLMTVDNVIRYNSSVSPDERFSGIHFDIEPYLLPGFQGPRRDKLLQSYLELLEKIAAKARPAGLLSGADIPFWYDSLDELTGEMRPVEFKGARKPASQHVIDLVDLVAVMAYRTTAYGADGVIALSQGELEYAAGKGKQVFVGLETTELPDEELAEFAGEPLRGLPPETAPRCVVLVPESEGVALYLLFPGQLQAFGHHAGQQKIDPSALVWWPVRKTISVPGHRLTHWPLGLARLNQNMSESREELLRFVSFAGFAIHDYLGYKRLLEHDKPAEIIPHP
jgi:hypothetical protein